MSPMWTPYRQSKVRRNKDGTFKPWPGGKPDTRDSSFKGNHIHLAAEFKRQTGRAAKVGDIHRHMNQDGSYHGQSWWWIKTPHGWRRSTTAQVKPTAAQIAAQIAKSRPGGKKK